MKLAPSGVGTGAALPKASRATLVRQYLGLAVLLAGLLGGWLVAGTEIRTGWMALGPGLSGALVGGLFAAAATALGTLPVALSRQLSRRSSDVMLAFGAGVMLAASVFSLIVPALHATRTQGAGPWQSGLIVGSGILLGAAGLLLLSRFFEQRSHLPRQEGEVGDRDGGDRDGGDSASANGMRKAWLFVAAITLHNIPEGAAIGVAFAGLDPVGAMGLSTGIAIQDVPEGLAVALALRAVGHGRASAVLWGSTSGLVEPIFAVLGAALVQTFSGLLPWGLAGAAGAMLLVITREVIPESQKSGAGAAASAALMLGFVVMLLLDTSMT